MEPPDEVLMQQVRAGNVRLLSVLFDRHHVALFLFYVRMTGDRAWSEDLVQEVFYRILKYRASYQDGAPFATWMYRIARNTHFEQRGRRRRETPIEDGWDTPGRAGIPLEQHQEQMLLRRALLELPHPQREVLLLSRYQNLKYEQIAALLGCEVAAVKVRVHRALSSLREIFFQLSGRKAS
ncbi:MAG: RNA polymerase sigma factor [Acidobacteria bacterium]|nr:RNA polymerase sigma factor [Acidobacteriota bacterium]